MQGLTDDISQTSYPTEMGLNGNLFFFLLHEFCSCIPLYDSVSVPQCLHGRGGCLLPAFAAVLAAVTAPRLSGDQAGTKRVNQEERLSSEQAGTAISLLKNPEIIAHMALKMISVYIYI